MAAKKSPAARGKGNGGSRRRGQKYIRSSARPAKKKRFFSTDSLKKRQTAIFDSVSETVSTVHSLNTTTKIVASIIITVIAVLGLGSLIRSELTINEKQRRLDELEAQIAQQQMDNEELETMIKDRNQYVEVYAREKLGMVKPGERVYINTVGD